jgi:hypothetical protein
MSFRVGTYLQTNKGTDANAYGETAVYSLGVSHPTTTTTRWTPEARGAVAVAVGLDADRRGVQMCATKGFDAVEPDLLDGYQNSTGFPITGAQQIAYNTMIAGLAHAAGMTVAQKGDVDQAAALQPVFDWTLNEQCGEYDECAALSAYTAAGKAVWIVEYSGFPKVCAIDFPVAGAAAMYKSLDLTADPRTPCLSSTG